VVELVLGSAGAINRHMIRVLREADHMSSVALPCLWPPKAIA
jgi:hypothetical protein